MRYVATKSQRAEVGASQVRVAVAVRLEAGEPKLEGARGSGRGSNRGLSVLLHLLRVRQLQHQLLSQEVFRRFQRCDCWLCNLVYKSTSLFRSFSEMMEGWVGGWFEPGLPHAETLDI